MSRLLLRVLLGLVLLVLVGAVLTAAVGPLLIDTSPAPGVSDPRQAATSVSHFIELPFAGSGLLVHYLAAGPAPVTAEGRAFVLLHGFTFNAFTWDRLMPTLAEFGPTLAYDQPPYGLSAKPQAGEWTGENPYGKAAALTQLFTLLDAFGIQRAVLVGNSSGGTLALEAALARPDRVAGLILLSPWVHSKRPILPGWLARLPQMRRLAVLIARQLGTDSPLLDYSYADTGLIDDQRRRSTGIHRAVAGWDLAWAALLQHSLVEPVTISERLAQVTQPVLVITGAADRVVPVADTEAAAAALPHGTLKILPDCGHLPQQECPEPVAAAIRDWLQQTGLP